MTKRMLIDASHAEETRVVVMDGSRLEEFDLEAANRLPLKGNIYLAKVVRVEPSLQAAFVEYGGNRHGFLAFSEIHPDYYQIPAADRQKLIEMQEAEAREEAEEEEREAGRAAARRARKQSMTEQRRTAEDGLVQALEQAIPADGVDAIPADEPQPEGALQAADTGETVLTDSIVEAEPGSRVESVEQDMPPPETLGGDGPPASEAAAEAAVEALHEDEEPGGEENGADEGGSDESSDEGGGDQARRDPPRFMRHYKIQEVIRRRQVLLIQVVKEERGGKGAALTTYMSLAGRFSVLMPNSPRGGGVSRKITSVTDRRRLREAIDELDLPSGMSLIVRTAGAQRPKPEIQRDCEYLLRLWDSVRERTMASSAPALIYEEADLIKRSIRDGYARDMDEILVEGEDAYGQARDFMRMLMPEYSRKIQLYRDGATPLFARHGVEQQLDGMHSPTVQLKSGGYIVINQTEALVAIDVNSGRSTRERSIEDTAFRTNLEASDEIARQLRLRDLAGLIVIDFIDMDASKHDAAVERRLKDALRGDRARIQVGRISHFGLLEMSRQRLRPSLTEQTFVTCAHCEGRGIVRSPESAAIQVLRALEEEGAKRRAGEIAVHVNPAVAMYLLNRKRERLGQIEERFGMAVLFETDAAMHGAHHRIERLRAAEVRPERDDRAQGALRMDYAPEEAVEAEPVSEAVEVAPPVEAGAEGDARRPRRRRRGGRRENGTTEGAPAEGEETEVAAEVDAGPSEPAEEVPADGGPPVEPVTTAEGEDDKPRRRRGRRGGRRRREGEPAGAEGVAGEETADEEGEAVPEPSPRPAPEQPPRPAPEPPRYRGPTPADPYANQIDPIMAAMEAADRAAEEAIRIPRPPQPMAAATPDPVMAEAIVEPMRAAEVVVPVAMPVAVPIAAMATPEAAAAQPEPAPAPQPVLATVEPAIGPAVQPQLIGDAAAEAPKKKGWWRR
ncbi:MAG: Rne/Rng family ribonuclease [Rubritepida sp.]|nr:Rne/Rng family ribonuclease [Rubritepida sp.]